MKRLTTVLTFLLASCATLQTTHIGKQSTPVLWIGHAERSWPGFETAIDVAVDVLEAEYPRRTDRDGLLTDFVIEVWGSNDSMNTRGCDDPVLESDGPHRVLGCTWRECGLFGTGCGWHIAVRQLREDVGGLPHLPVYSGKLLDAGRSAFFDEVSDRMVPVRVGRLGDHDTAWTKALRDRMKVEYGRRMEGKL